MKKAYTFDDVLLVPQYSDTESRSLIDTSVSISRRENHISDDDYYFSSPIVSANMATVTGPDMANEISYLGGLAIMHRFESAQERIDNYKKVCKSKNISISIGVTKEEENIFCRWAKFFDENLIDSPIICVDVAHGHHLNTKRMIGFIKSRMPYSFVIAGNIATAAGAKFLIDSGADIIKVGVGGGSLCTTRIETGNGVPQLSALMDVREALGPDAKIIADGGIRNSGDMVKALCFANMVMLGNLLAGTDEAPGDIIEVPGGGRYKRYVGSSTHKTSHIEGVKAMVPYKGPVNRIFKNLMEGLRSGMSYQGAKNLAELRDNPEFIEVTVAGKIESNHHDVIVL